jgi:Glycosyltransferase family 87
MMPRPATTTASYRLLITTVVGFGAAVNAVTLFWMLRYHPLLNSDFMAFWSLPRFAASQPLNLMFDPQTVQAFQDALYPGFRSLFPFTYPPDFLLACWWLRDFAYTPAKAIWTLAGLASLIPAAWYLFRPQRSWICVTAILASPAATLNLVLGQTAFFSTALLLSGLALLPKRPVLAGVAFGLLTLKPQLGILLPFFLLARGEWRAIGTAALTSGALIGLSCVLLPPKLWLLWAASLPAYQHDYFSSHGLNLNILVTPAANLITLGVRPAFAWAAQTLCTAIVALLVFLTARRAPYRLAVAALLAGSFLAVPHAYAYDTVTLPAAMALCLTARTPLPLVLLGCVLYLAPLVLLSPEYRYFLYAIPEALLFGAIILLALDKPNSVIIAHEPNPVPATQP